MKEKRTYDNHHG